ncbi:MAG: ATP-binding cassette domain-containing protein [Syntrophales bacterium]|jgi:molybdate transport system ATP-binding protein
MGLNVKIGKKLKYFDLDIDFTCPEENLLVMIGPSGGGKTSIIRMIAGLDKPDSGTITFNGETWFDASRRIHVPPQKRKLGYVFQDYTLFPHLSLYENAAFAAVDKKEVKDLLELFGIAHLHNRKPHIVSGGERQRCALCQALARRPQALLLDEPFSALDFVARRNLRGELKNLRGELLFPIIYVTHDINEALILADEILPIVDGREDKGWMQRAITRESSTGLTERAVREPRLALVY